jgi:hypothetical protein
MKKWSFVALLLAAATVLGATAFREPIASAAQSVSATIAGPLDDQGNVRVAVADPALHPFQFQAFISIPAGVSSAEAHFSVPAGKRLVLESASVRTILNAGDTPDFEILTTADAVSGDHEVVPSQQGDFAFGRLWTGEQSLRLYADGGTDVDLSFEHNDTGTNANAFFTVSGYLVTVP